MSRWSLVVGVLVFVVAALVSYRMTRVAEEPLVPIPRVKLSVAAVKDTRVKPTVQVSGDTKAVEYNYTTRNPSRAVWERSGVKRETEEAVTTPANACDGGTKLFVPTVDAFRAVRSLLLRGRREGHPVAVDDVAARLSGQTQSTWSQAQIERLTDAAVVDDGYCDCLDGTDEPATGACDRSLRRDHLAPSVTAPKRCTVETLRGVARLYGSRVNDGVPDCCDCSDEPAKAGGCQRQCPRELQIARQRVSQRRKLLLDGVAKCRQRVVHGRDAFAPAFKAVVADRELWITEADTFLRAQVALLQKKTSDTAKKAKASEKTPSEAELRSFAEFLSIEGAKQQLYRHLIETNALGKMYQYYPFAPPLQVLSHDDTSKQGDPEVTARKARFAAAVERKALCVSATRHETSFRGGSADPQSFNYTFAVCPFEHTSMIRADTANSSDVDGAAGTGAPGAPKPTILGRYGTAHVDMSLTSFHALFETDTGATSLAELQRSENPLIFFSMQLVNKRPNAHNTTHLKDAAPSGIGRSPLHPFDYDVVAGPSVKSSTVWMGNGEDCWGGPHRHVRVAFVCSDVDGLLDIHENGKCAYEAVVHTPSACCHGESDEEVDSEVKGKLQFMDEEARRIDTLLRET